MWQFWNIWTIDERANNPASATIDEPQIDRFLGKVNYVDIRRTDGRTDEHYVGTARTDYRTKQRLTVWGFCFFCSCLHYSTLKRFRFLAKVNYVGIARTDGRTDRREHYVGTARTDYRTKQRLTVWGFFFLQLPPLFNVKEIVSIESML